MSENQSILALLFTYLNIIGIALITAFLICLGLKYLFPQKKMLSKKNFIGITWIIIAILILIRSFSYMILRG
jgi:hypothetical protein